MTSDAWFYRVGETSVGPVPSHELRRLVGTGQLGPGIPLWRDGMHDWVPMSQVPGLLPAENGIQFLVPTGRTSGSSMAAGYLGLFGLLFIPLAPFALVLGVLGVRDLRRHPEKNGWGRAITGIVLGGLLTLALLFFAGLMAFR